MLPPDASGGPAPGGGPRTSPTNVRLYLRCRGDRARLQLGGIDRDGREVRPLDSVPLERVTAICSTGTTLGTCGPSSQCVSTVDSGNQPGHLIALGNACREMARVGDQSACTAAADVETGAGVPEQAEHDDGSDVATRESLAASLVAWKRTWMRCRPAVALADLLGARGPSRGGGWVRASLCVGENDPTRAEVLTWVQSLSRASKDTTPSRCCCRGQRCSHCTDSLESEQARVGESWWDTLSPTGRLLRRTVLSLLAWGKRLALAEE